MAKLTRKSYKRKKVAFAAILLGGVALVSSGFAAWVLSAQADSKEAGSIDVATVVNGALEMKVYKYKSEGAYNDEDLIKDNGGSFSFNADSSDTEGKGTSSNRFYYSEIEGEKPELLYNTYYIEVTSKADSLASLSIKFAIDDVHAENVTGLSNDKFISLPESSSGAGKVFEKGSAWSNSTLPSDLKKDGANSITVTDGATSGTYKWAFVYTVAFGWGGRFNDVNPCFFFDSEETSKDKTDARTNVDGVVSYGKGYGTASGKTIDYTVIGEDMDHFHSAIDEATYTLTFTATGM